MAGSVHRAVWLLAVAFMALNLCPFLTAVGPLSGSIQAGAGLDFRAMAWLTLLPMGPMGLMGVGAWCTPAVLRRWGTRSTVVGALSVLALGCAMRLAGVHGRCWSSLPPCAARAWRWCRARCLVPSRVNCPAMLRPSWSCIRRR